MLVMPALLLLLFVSLAIASGQREAAYCLTDQCTTDHPPSLYEQYCCNSDNIGSIIMITDDGRAKFIICPNTLPTSCSRLLNSCIDILTHNPNASSGYYNIIHNDGSIASVYCDMEGDNCDGEGGWMRVADINTTLPDATCPDGLTLFNISGLNACSNGNDTGCASTTFSSHQYNYSKVCGQVRGYRYGHPLGFYGALAVGRTIDFSYVDGVSITYDSSPRRHIWTYAAGARAYHNASVVDCPCNNNGITSNGTVSPPSFVGDDYYCEAAPSVVDITDILWDGQECNGLEGPCCTAPNMPWFTTTLNSSITSDIEVRLCRFNVFRNIPVDIIQLYVK